MGMKNQKLEKRPDFAKQKIEIQTKEGRINSEVDPVGSPRPKNCKSRRSRVFQKMEMNNGGLFGEMESSGGKRNRFLTTFE